MLSVLLLNFLLKSQEVVLTKKYTKEQVIKTVTKCAVQYCTHLMDKSLLFITTDKHKKISAAEVFFEKWNYLHLTGLIVDKTVISAERFLDMCVSQKLSPHDFEIREDGTTKLKLDILPFLMTKNLSANAIGNYNGSGMELYTEKIAGSVKGCMGFRTDGITHHLVPNTILNKDIRLCTNYPQDRIIAAFRKRKEDVKYSEIVYIAKKVDWHKLKFPEEYTYLYNLIKNSRISPIQK